MIELISTTTNNVTREILRIATQKNTSISNFYIKINAIHTFMKENEDVEGMEMSPSMIEEYKKELYLRDSNILFEQQYEIDVLFKEDNYPFKDMLSDIEFTHDGTYAYFIIKKGAKLHYYDELYHDFIAYIEEQKLKAHIMLYLFDVDYTKTLKQYVDIIQKVKKITFPEDKKFLISKGLCEVKSIKANVTMILEENNNVQSDEHHKVDYSDRGFLLSCTEGEQLFEFSKPKQGQNGRTCLGKIIEVETVNLDAKPMFTIENSIEIEDSFENIKYLSTKSGYLVKNGDKYEVSNSLTVDEISFKTTGTIDTDLDSEISINVEKEDPLEDAIENGMHVKVQKINITGSIGSNTSIEAREVSISGQSHKDSSIKCVNAKIGVHKGKIIGRDIEVQRLEGGEIIADKVIIHNSLSGKVRARTIEIEVLGSHVVMEASEYIQIESVKGEENHFIINELFDSGFGDNRVDDEKYLKKLTAEISDLKKIFKDSTLQMKKNLEPCKKIKMLILNNQKKGIEIASTLITKFKKCKIMNTRYKKLKDTIEEEKTKSITLEKRLSKEALTIMDTKIIVNNPLKGFNHITYKLTHPEREIKINTTQYMTKKIFKLEKDKEGILRIVNID